jgi:hypothetical protein
MLSSYNDQCLLTRPESIPPNKRSRLSQRPHDDQVDSMTQFLSLTGAGWRWTSVIATRGPPRRDRPAAPAWLQAAMTYGMLLHTRPGRLRPGRVVASASQVTL